MQDCKAIRAMNVCFGVVMEDYLLEEWLWVLRMTLSRLMLRSVCVVAASRERTLLSGVGLDIEVIEDIDMAP